MSQLLRLPSQLLKRKPRKRPPKLPPRLHGDRILFQTIDAVHALLLMDTNGTTPLPKVSQLKVIMSTRVMLTPSDLVDDLSKHL